MLYSVRVLACCIALAGVVQEAQSAGWSLLPGSGLGDARTVAMRLVATGTVLAVDHEARLMAVQGPQGSITFRLDPLVDNAARIAVGDRVQVDYVAGMLIVPRRGSKDDARDVADSAASQRAMASAPLATSYDRPLVFVSNVVAVDKDNLVLRLKGPQGEMSEYPVSDRAALAGVRAGQRLKVTMNQAVAVRVTPLTVGPQVN